MFLRVHAGFGIPSSSASHLGDDCMFASATARPDTFIDRRGPNHAGTEPLFERRQFANSYDELSPDAAGLARALEGYKVQHRRRFVTYEEILSVIKSLGYSR